MKTKAAFFVLGFALLESAQVLACSPPRDRLYVQPEQITEIAKSTEVFQKLRELGGRDIESIRDERGIYSITSTNGCVVKVRVKYTQPSSPGMCPSLDGVEILEGYCQ